MRVLTEAAQFKADAKLIEFIEDKLGKLDQFFDQIINAKVQLRLENSGQVKDKIVEVTLNVPGDQLFARSSEKSFESAIDDASKALERQLKKYKAKIKQ